MAKNGDAALREHVLELLTGGHAHATFEQAVKNLPVELRGKVPNGAEHSPWQLLEHLRIAQRDILEFSRNAKHVSPEWPEGYWPSTQAPPNAKEWEKSLKSFAQDLGAMKKLVANNKTNLYAKIPHGTGQTILREVLLVADHNAYHLGQVIAIRLILGNWR